MDLSNLTTNERTIEILNPKTDEELGIRVTIVSYFDKSVKKAERKIMDKTLALQSRRKTPKATDLEDNTFEMVFSAMKSWDWYGEDVNFDGEKPEMTKDNVRKIFDKLPWLMGQIDDAIADDKAFFTESKAT